MFNVLNRETPSAVVSVSAPTIDKIDVNSNGTTYYGTGLAGSVTSTAVWQIQSSSVAGVVTTFLWADGNTNFDNVWDNRTSLTYA